MARFTSHAAVLAVLFGGAVALSADETPEKPAAKPATADPTVYVKAFETTGEIVKVGDNGFTLRMTWYESGGSGGRGRSGASAYRSLMNGRTPRPRSSGGSGGAIKEQHEDYDLTFADGGLVRWDKAMQVPGAAKNGHVPVELQNKLKLPSGAPGWAGEKGHLKEGHIVEVTLVRPKNVPDAKLTPADLRVKYALIQGEKKTPSAADDKDDVADKNKKK